MLPVPPSQATAKHCHSRLAHTAAMLMVREHTPVHDSVCACVSPLHLLPSLSLRLLCVMSEHYYRDRLLTGHTDWNTVVMQLSHRHTHTHTQSSRQDWAGSVCHWSTQICSGWWQTTAVEPVAACISFNILANVQREARASRKPLDPSQTSYPTTTPVLCNVLISTVGSV